jgi:hypothetical protein
LNNAYCSSDEAIRSPWIDPSHCKLTWLSGCNCQGPATSGLIKDCNRLLARENSEHRWLIGVPTRVFISFTKRPSSLLGTNQQFNLSTKKSKHVIRFYIWNLSGTSKTGYPISIVKSPTKTNITAHGPSQPAQALLRSKPKQKDNGSSPSAPPLCPPLSVSTDPRDVIRASEPRDVIKALDPFAQLPLRSM